MQLFSKYLEDESFTNWVYKPTVDNTTFWETYRTNHPDERETIDQLRKILLALKTDDIHLTEKESKAIFNAVMLGVNQGKRSTIRSISLKVMRYAALLIFIFGLGVYFVSESIWEEEFPLEDMLSTAIDSITETQLILTSGKQLVIPKTQSTIEYTHSGDVIVNQNDTLNHSQAAIKKEVLNQLIVPFGKRSKIVLADGSIVHLNAGSRFIFPKKFIGNQRKVFLDGEAFFEVTTNKNRPFVVKTLEKEFEIEVVGTKFNVSSYSSDDYIATVLAEGEVHINKVINFLYSEKTKMKPGELLTWRKSDKEIAVKEVNAANYILWREGLLQFESRSIVEIAKKIERFYNIQIDITPSSGNEIRISGKLDLNDDVEKTLANFAAAAALKLDKIDTKKYEIK
ncbi:MAG: FecR domain-containing protein [Flavobacteriaceae bacterium]